MLSTSEFIKVRNRKFEFLASVAVPFQFFDQLIMNLKKLSVLTVMEGLI